MWGTARCYTTLHYREWDVCGGYMGAAIAFSAADFTPSPALRTIRAPGQQAATATTRLRQQSAV